MDSLTRFWWPTHFYDIFKITKTLKNILKSKNKNKELQINVSFLIFKYIYSILFNILQEQVLHIYVRRVLHPSWSSYSPRTRRLGWEFAQRFSEQISKLLVFCKKMSEWAICSKKRVICSCAHFWWATWAICSHCSPKKREGANHSFFK